MRDMKENIITPDNFIVRTMNRSEIDLAITWAASEGWNPGRYDAESFYQTDKNGFFVGELNGEPVACISAVTYDQHFGILGLYRKIGFKAPSFYDGFQLVSVPIHYTNDSVLVINHLKNLVVERHLNLDN